jgi:hypothetical protein
MISWRIYNLDVLSLVTLFEYDIIYIGTNLIEKSIFMLSLFVKFPIDLDT